MYRTPLFYRNKNDFYASENQTDAQVIHLNSQNEEQKTGVSINPSNV